MEIPKHIIDKALQVHRMHIKQRDIMVEIDNWLENKGYDVDFMRSKESFQVPLEYGEFETEEILITTIKSDLQEFKGE